MEITIAYRGRLADPRRIEDFEDRLIDFALGDRPLKSWSMFFSAPATASTMVSETGSRWDSPLSRAAAST
jgi:hypothetical protein